jgi:hypothetical protein
MKSHHVSCAKVLLVFLLITNNFVIEPYTSHSFSKFIFYGQRVCAMGLAELVCLIKGNEGVVSLIFKLWASLQRHTATENGRQENLQTFLDIQKWAV